MALPPLVAAVVAHRALRGRPLTWDRIALAGCGGGLAAGVGFALLASLSGGAAGPGRMRFVGPFTRDVLVHAVTACGIGALLGASVAGLVRVARRPGRRAPRSGPGARRVHRGLTVGAGHSHGDAPLPRARAAADAGC